jgi:hypothetical protein
MPITDTTFPISRNLPTHTGVALKNAQDEVNRVVAEINTADYVTSDSPTLITPTASNATLTGTTTFTGAHTSTSGPAYYTGTAPPTGGSAGVGIKLSSTSNLGIFFGAGAPTLAAAVGSIYIRTDGTSTGDRFYINTGGTTWTAGTTLT